MTFLGRLVALFPLLHALGSLWSALQFIQHPNLLSGSLLIICLYLIPPLLFRLYIIKRPIKAGRWILNHPKHCDWWIAHQLQMVYAAVPVLEALLRLIPGAYSAWLRLWGSKIGQGVYWTVRVEILDRHLLKIDDGAVFGHLVRISSHVIHRKTNGDLILFVRPTHIGKEALIGARAHIGPGVRIPKKSVVPYNAEYKLSYAP